MGPKGSDSTVNWTNITTTDLSNLTLQEFFSGSTLDVATSGPVSGLSTSWDQGTGVLTVTGSGFNAAVNLTIGANIPTSADFLATYTGGVVQITTDLPCYAAGTHIRTDRGEVAVEDLAVGDAVAATLHGPWAKVVWLGHREVDCARHPRPHDVWPVRIVRDAFGPGQPARDLWLSPDHALHVDGVLIPVRYLLNGATIVQVPTETVSYWHVELACHDVILAEGLACESYLDTGNRGAFANGGGAVQLHPDFALKVWEREACAPLVTGGTELGVARSYLLWRAEQLGCALTGDAALRLGVDGRLLRPVVAGNRYSFALPGGARRARLVSRSTVPAYVDTESDDYRRLGVAVSAIALDGEPLALDGPALGTGWYAREAYWRWTDGDAELLLPGGGVLAVDIAITARYWLEAPAVAAVAA